MKFIYNIIIHIILTGNVVLVQCYAIRYIFKIFFKILMMGYNYAAAAEHLKNAISVSMRIMYWPIIILIIAIIMIITTNDSNININNNNNFNNNNINNSNYNDKNNE